jgi:hypothetical protein
MTVDIQGVAQQVQSRHRVAIAAAVSFTETEFSQ